MNQKCPLLHYRVKCESVEPTISVGTAYDIKVGLWIDENGVPSIEKYINNNKESIKGETLITKTREGVDRSEGASNFSSIETATRESIDRSENSYVNNSYDNQINPISVMGQTMETRTRESIDRSEMASECSETEFQSIQTYTRESIDRSEKS